MEVDTSGMDARIGSSDMFEVYADGASESSLGAGVTVKTRLSHGEISKNSCVSKLNFNLSADEADQLGKLLIIAAAIHRNKLRQWEKEFNEEFAPVDEGDDPDDNLDDFMKRLEDMDMDKEYDL
jgi:hypothetical protein